MIFLPVQLEELLEPYLADIDLGVPYWDWTKNLKIPNIWKDVFTPLKEPHSKYYDKERERLQRKSLTRKKFKTFFQVKLAYKLNPFDFRATNNPMIFQQNYSGDFLRRQIWKRQLLHQMFIRKLLIFSAFNWIGK